MNLFVEAFVTTGHVHTIDTQLQPRQILVDDDNDNDNVGESSQTPFPPWTNYRWKC